VESGSGHALERKVEEGAVGGKGFREEIAVAGVSVDSFGVPFFPMR
jgi:hypothetical protein